MAEREHMALEDQHTRTRHSMWNKGFSLILVAPMMPKKDTDIGDIEIIEKKKEHTLNVKAPAMFKVSCRALPITVIISNWIRGLGLGLVPTCGSES